MTLKEELDLERDTLREYGITGDLHVVPISHVRCFVPCAKGQCVCIPTVRGRFCVVDDAGKEKALRMANEELQFLTKELRK